MWFLIYSIISIMFDRELITSVHLPTLTAFSLQIGENLTFYYRIKKLDRDKSCFSNLFRNISNDYQLFRKS